MKLHSKGAALIACASLVALTACGTPPNYLEGSIDSNVSLDFDSTRMIRYTSLAIQLEYIKALEGSETPDIVAKIVFDTPEGGIPQGEPIDLKGANAVVERIVAAGDNFPALDTGRITFDEGGNDPGPAVGSFACTFDNGRTLNGDFDVEMEDVDF
jgi:hypothetical protein